MIWYGVAPSANAVAAVARQAFDSGVPVVWISTDGPHPPRFLVDFDKSGNALASETDCTEGPLALALSPIAGGPKAKVDHSGISPKEGLQNFYSESWHPHCYSTVYDFLRRVTTYRWPRAVIKTRAYSDQCCDWALYVVRTFRTFGLAIREYVAHLVWRFRLRLPADAGGVFVRWSFV